MQKPSSGSSYRILRSGTSSPRCLARNDSSTSTSWTTAQTLSRPFGPGSSLRMRCTVSENCSRLYPMGLTSSSFDTLFAPASQWAPYAPPVLLRLGRRRRRLRYYGRGYQRAHRLLPALPAHPRGVRVGARGDGGRVLLRLRGLCHPESHARPPHGPSRPARRERDRRVHYGRGPPPRHLRARAVAALSNPRGARGRRQRVPRLHGAGPLSPPLVRPPSRPRHEPRLLRRGGGLHRDPAVDAAAHRAKRLARRVLGHGHRGARAPRPPEPPAPAAPRGSGARPRWRRGDDPG